MQKALKVSVRRAQILEFALQCRASNRPQFTVSEVARALGVRPSTKLRAMIRPLVDWGLLVEDVEVYVGAVPVRYVYRVSDETYKRNQGGNRRAEREIRINGILTQVGLS